MKFHEFRRSRNGVEQYRNEINVMLQFLRGIEMKMVVDADGGKWQIVSEWCDRQKMRPNIQIINVKISVDTEAPRRDYKSLFDIGPTVDSCSSTTVEQRINYE